MEADLKLKKGTNLVEKCKRYGIGDQIIIIYNSNQRSGRGKATQKLGS
jgi:hypothetical protein